MSEITLKRTYPSSPETVFAFVTQSEHLLKWWGPEGVFIAANALDLSKPGKWFSVMQNKEGQTFKVSGEVVKVEAPHSVEFTWAWHNDKDTRGHESLVRFSVKPGENGGSDFTLHHTQLSDDEAAANHNQGWTSSLLKLDKLAG